MPRSPGSCWSTSAGCCTPRAEPGPIRAAASGRSRRTALRDRSPSRVAGADLDLPIEQRGLDHRHRDHGAVDRDRHELADVPCRVRTDPGDGVAAQLEIDGRVPRVVADDGDGRPIEIVRTGQDLGTRGQRVSGLQGRVGRQGGDRQVARHRQRDGFTADKQRGDRGRREGRPEQPPHAGSARRRSVSSRWSMSASVAR